MNLDIHEKIKNWHSEDGVTFFNQMYLPNNAVFLDFGSGYGEYTVALALSDSSSTVYAIDKDKKMIKCVEEKVKHYGVQNIRLLDADLCVKTDLADAFADLVLMYDFIHGNDLKTKLPLRFKYFEEAKRVLKKNGILSIAPFECANLRDKNGKYKKYKLDKLISEIEECGFKFNNSINGAIHFDYYHSSYHWKKLNGNMPFDYLEQMPALNFLSL